MQVQEVERLSNEDIMTLSKFHFMEPEAIPKPKYKYPPVIFLILDYLIGSTCVVSGKSVKISNLAILTLHY